MNYFIGQWSMAEPVKPLEHNLLTPIEWIPVKADGDRVLIISKNVLDWDCYGFRSDMNNYWQDSCARKYLDDFFESAFSDEEKKAILDTKVGKLFFFSKNEIEMLIPKEENRRAVMFAVEEVDKSLQLTIEHQAYWLRNDKPANEEQEVYYVDSLGGIETGDPDMDEVGIRPAMWVDIKSARQLTGKRGHNFWHHMWKPEDY